MKPAKNRAPKSPQSATATGKKSKGFTDEERAAMRERLQELKAEARRGRGANKAERDNAVLAALAAMPQPDRAMGERLHAIIKPMRQSFRRKPGTGCPRMPRMAIALKELTADKEATIGALVKKAVS